jgi:predicted dehydrogenase
MENKISIGIIGGGINSAVGYAHFSAINLSNKFVIKAGCFSRNAEKNNESAQIYNVDRDRLYIDYRHMLNAEKSKIDAVVILTPTNQHIEQILYAIKLGIPVICEKSLTINYTDILKIKELSDKRFCSVVFNYICYPMLKELRNIINNKKLGKINQIQIEMPQEGFLRLKNDLPVTPQNWRLVDGTIPTISLDIGTHVYSIVKFLTNEIPLEAIAIQNNFGNFDGVVDDVNAIVKYSNDVICNMWYSKSALGNRNGLRVRIYGTNGSAEWYQNEPEYLILSDNNGMVQKIDRSSTECNIANQLKYNRFKVGHPSGFIEALANFYEDVYNDLFAFINNKTINKETFGIKESEECIRLLEAISLSSKYNKWIKIK